MEHILADGIQAAVVALLINDVIVDIAQEFVQRTHANSNITREDPLLQFAWGLIDGIVSDLSLAVARVAVSEAADQILLEKRCRIARDALEDEIIVEALMPRADNHDHDRTGQLSKADACLADVFKEAIEEENESQAVLALLDDLLEREVRIVCAEMLGSYQLDAALVLRERAREIVEMTSLKVICPRLLLSHLLVSVAQRHGAVMLEFLASEVLARRVVLERLTAMLDAEEQAIDLVCDDGALGQFFSHASIPSVQVVRPPLTINIIGLLVPLFVSASRELEDAVSALETHHLLLHIPRPEEEETGMGEIDDREADIYSASC